MLEIGDCFSLPLSEIEDFLFQQLQIIWSGSYVNVITVMESLIGRGNSERWGLANSQLLVGELTKRVSQFLFKPIKFGCILIAIKRIKANCSRKESLAFSSQT